MKTPKPVVSVVTALYNSASFIGETIESVLAQSFSDWEMIIVDDCSTDNSASIAAGYSEKDSRIVIISLKENGGAAISRNTAIEAAKGRYIAFLDSDDRWHHDKLEKQLAFMQKSNFAFTHTWFEKYDEEGNSLGVIVTPPESMNYKSLLKSNRIGCLTVIYDTEKLGKVFMPLIRKRQDYGLWLKILKSGTDIHVLPENLAFYSVRSGSISDNKLEMVKYNWMLYRKVEKFDIFRSTYYLSWNVFRKLRNG